MEDIASLKSKARRALWPVLLAGVSCAPFASADEQSGEELFMANCSVCHGVKGDGHGSEPWMCCLPKPRNLTTDEIRARTNVDYIFHTAKHGFGVMPAFEGKLDDEQIRKIAEYVRHTIMKAE